MTVMRRSVTLGSKQAACTSPCSSGVPATKKTVFTLDLLTDDGIGEVQSPVQQDLEELARQGRIRTFLHLRE